MDISKINGNTVDSIKKSRAHIENEISRPPVNDNDNSGGIKDSGLSITSENAQNVVDTLNSAAKSVEKKVSFSYHEETNSIIFQIKDSKTNEVIREVPPREMIRLLEHIHEMMGVFIDESR